ncbi:MAG: DegT/DnrJ/EryC1/StrS family aminotransferase, partial [bacterium]
YVATVEAIIQAGAYPIFADINPATLTIDPRDIGKKISHKTLAIVPVDMAGYPCDYDALNKICNDNSVAMIADSAHAIGAAYKKKSIPNHCDGAVYSFYSTKNLTCGEGGLVATRHKILGNRVRMITGHGLSKSTYKRKKDSSWEYDAIAAGYKANMSEIHAAIGLGQFKTYKKDQKTRIDLAKQYLKNLSGLKEYLFLPVEEKNYQHGWHLFIIKLNLANLRIDRNQFIIEMAKAGVECGVHYKPIFELSFYRDHFGLSRQMFPNTFYAYQCIVTLPLYPLLKKNDVDFVCEKIEKIIKKHKR